MQQAYPEALAWYVCCIFSKKAFHSKRPFRITIILAYRKYYHQIQTIPVLFLFKMPFSFVSIFGRKI